MSEVSSARSQHSLSSVMGRAVRCNSREVVDAILTKPGARAMLTNERYPFSVAVEGRNHQMLAYLLTRVDDFSVHVADGYLVARACYIGATRCLELLLLHGRRWPPQGWPVHRVLDVFEKADGEDPDHVAEIVLRHKDAFDKPHVLHRVELDLMTGHYPRLAGLVARRATAEQAKTTCWDSPDLQLP